MAAILLHHGMCLARAVAKQRVVARLERECELDEQRALFAALYRVSDLDVGSS